MPLGVAVWLVLIFLITCGAVEGFFPMIATILGLLILGSFIFSCIVTLRSSSKAENRRKPTPGITREQAIDEWEKKWQRRHPSRINNKKGEYDN